MPAYCAPCPVNMKATLRIPEGSAPAPGCRAASSTSISSSRPVTGAAIR
jgi:hypothetical protein